MKIHFHRLLAIILCTVIVTQCQNENKKEGVTGSKTGDLVALVGLVILIAVPPNVRIVNSSGGSQTYSVHEGSSCTTATKNTWGAIANGATSGYLTTGSAGAYSFSFGSPASSNCFSGSFAFQNNLKYTCTSSGGNLTCVLP